MELNLDHILFFTLWSLWLFAHFDVIALEAVRIHAVHLMNVEQHPPSSNPESKQTDLTHRFTRTVCDYSQIHTHLRYLLRSLEALTHLLSQEGSEIMHTS